MVSLDFPFKPRKLLLPKPKDERRGGKTNSGEWNHNTNLASHVPHSRSAERGLWNLSCAMRYNCDTVLVLLLCESTAAGSGTTAQPTTYSMQPVMMGPYGVSNNNKKKKHLCEKIKRNIFLGAICCIPCIILTHLPMQESLQLIYCMLLRRVKSNNFTCSLVWGLWFKGHICWKWLEREMLFHILYIVCWPYSPLYQLKW